MNNRLLNFFKKRDRNDYLIIRKAFFLSLFTIKPMYVWEKFPEDFYRAFELNEIELCKDRSIMDIVLRIKYENKNVKTLMSLKEMINIYNLVLKVRDLEGDLAEVGVYQGGSATIISKAKDEKNLHLFDTFEGLPDTDKKHDKLEKGDMNNTSLEKVKKNLIQFKNVFFYQGFFPDTALPVTNKKFCFVNLDTDLYSSTKACLEFFYSRMVNGGIIITHDYNDSRTPGVKEAFDEFFKDKPEYILEIWETQAYIIKSSSSEMQSDVFTTDNKLQTMNN